MNYYNFIVALIVITSMVFPFVVFADNEIDDSQSFSDRIVTLQDETRSICSYIEGVSLLTTKKFKELIQDAHLHCPDIKNMEVTLVTVDDMAKKYHSYVTKQLSGCQNLLNMLTKGLESGGLVVFYLREGNYSLVTSIIDQWHESFTKVHTNFYVVDAPLEFMLETKKIFYYDSWIRGIAQSTLMLIGLLGGSVALIKIFLWIDLVLWIAAIFSPLPTNFHQQQLSTNDNSSRKIGFNAHSDNQNPPQRNANAQGCPSNENDNGLLASNTPESITTISPKLLANVTKLVWFITLSVLIMITALWYPSEISFSKVERQNWYPDATETLQKMRVDRDYLQSTLSVRILTIEELKRHASMYRDKAIQENVDELVRNLATGFRQANKELSDAYVHSEKMPSVFRGTYKHIEEKAGKAGRLSEANNLLIALNQSSGNYEILQRSLQTLVIQQEKVLPILKEQTQSMQALVHEGHLIEIGRIIKHHYDTLIHIDENTFKVKIEIKQLIEIVSDEHTDGMKKAIESLKDQTVTDQIKAMLYGVTGTATSTMLGMLAFKSGYVMVSVTATAVAGPIALAAGGVGVIGLGVYSAVTNYDNYNDASRYKTELDVLETERVKLKVAMEQLNKAITDQQEALKTSQTSLNRIGSHSALFSEIPGFILNTIQRSAIDDELLNIISQYNQMMSIYELFTRNLGNNHRASPPA